MRFYIKKDCTAPFLTAVLQAADGTPLDLTDATATFTMTKPGASTPKVDAEDCVITSPEDGRLRYEWQAGDTDELGTFNAEIAVTYPSNAVERFPSRQYLSVIVQPSLS